MVGASKIIFRLKFVSDCFFTSNLESCTAGMCHYAHLYIVAPMHSCELCAVSSWWSSEIGILTGLLMRQKVCDLYIVYSVFEDEDSIRHA